MTAARNGSANSAVVFDGSGDYFRCFASNSAGDDSVDLGAQSSDFPSLLTGLTSQTS